MYTYMLFEHLCLSFSTCALRFQIPSATSVGGMDMTEKYNFTHYDDIENRKYIEILETITFHLIILYFKLD